MCWIARSPPLSARPAQVDGIVFRSRFIMNLPQGWLALVLWIGGLACASALTWVACRWWYGRKLKAAAGRLHKSDQGRLASQQQTTQARRQIESLREELEVLRRSAAHSQTHRNRARELESSLAHAERSIDEEEAAQPASHGFADTQVLP